MAAKITTDVLIDRSDWVSVGSKDKDNTIENVTGCELYLRLEENKPTSIYGHELLYSLVPAGSQAWVRGSDSIAANGQGSAIILVTE